MCGLAVERMELGSLGVVVEGRLEGGWYCGSGIWRGEEGWEGWLENLDTAPGVLGPESCARD